MQAPGAISATRRCCQTCSARSRVTGKSDRSPPTAPTITASAMTRSLGGAHGVIPPSRTARPCKAATAGAVARTEAAIAPIWPSSASATRCRMPCGSNDHFGRGAHLIATTSLAQAASRTTRKSHALAIDKDHTVVIWPPRAPWPGRVRASHRSESGVGWYGVRSFRSWRIRGLYRRRHSVRERLV